MAKKDFEFSKQAAKSLQRYPGPNPVKNSKLDFDSALEFTNQIR